MKVKVQCGWLVDKYGIHWQVVPSQIMEWINASDPERAARVLNAVWGMVKLDIPTLQAAFEGEEKQ